MLAIPNNYIEIGVKKENSIILHLLKIKLDRLGLDIALLVNNIGAVFE
jgi:hypothetical protein